MLAVLDADTVAFLHGGCALIVATVGADGRPHASRGWGLTVADDDPAEVRLVLDAADLAAADRLAGGGAVAVTAADVPSLRSLQLKGRAVALEPATDADVAAAARYRDAFFGDIERVDGTPRATLDRIVPDAYVTAVVAVTDLFDQTPGPGAGSALGAASP